MTESEWQSCRDPQAMLKWLRDSEKTSERKLRLFAVACARRVVHLSLEARSHRAVEMAEQFADGLTTNRMRGNAYRLAKEAAHGAPAHCQNARYASAYAAHSNPIQAAAGACSNGQMAMGYRVDGEYKADLHQQEKRPQCALLRDIFPTSFCPVTLDSTGLNWNDSTIRKLAQAIYAERAFDRLPILADALEEAGCENEEILSHCRARSDHVRGCWLIDLLLGRE
jgi:hypothetical protein